MRLTGPERSVPQLAVLEPSLRPTEDAFRYHKVMSAREAEASLSQETPQGRGLVN